MNASLTSPWLLAPSPKWAIDRRVALRVAGADGAVALDAHRVAGGVQRLGADHDRVEAEVEVLGVPRAVVDAAEQAEQAAAGRRRGSRRRRARGRSGRRSPAGAARGRRRSARPPGRAAGPRCRARRGAGGRWPRCRSGGSAPCRGRSRAAARALKSRSNSGWWTRSPSGVSSWISSGPPSACEGPKTSTRSGPNSGIQHSLCPGGCGISASRGIQWAERLQGWRNRDDPMVEAPVTSATGVRQKVADGALLGPIEREPSAHQVKRPTSRCTSARSAARPARWWESNAAGPVQHLTGEHHLAVPRQWLGAVADREVGERKPLVAGVPRDAQPRPHLVAVDEVGRHGGPGAGRHCGARGRHGSTLRPPTDSFPGLRSSRRGRSGWRRRPRPP